MDVYESLARSVVDYNPAGAGQAAKTIVDEGLDPIKGLESISGSMKIIGDGYSTGELFLPDLVAAADASQAAMPILEDEIKRRGEKSISLGTVVIGTVKGDIHTIGKSMVGVLLTAAGFRVVDVGANVPADGFIEAIKESEADILALSALLTTTAPQQGKVIEALTEAGIRDSVKIMVGGGAITPEFGEQIGADGYGGTAPGAVDLAKQLMAA